MDTGDVAVAMRRHSFEWSVPSLTGDATSTPSGRAGRAGEDLVKLSHDSDSGGIAPEARLAGPRDPARRHGVPRLSRVTFAPNMFITKPFIRDRRIRFALVGCGRISANHFDALEKHAERAELVGVCDIDPEALRRAEERTGAPGFRTLDALLAGTDADIVILATPSGLHAEQAMQVAAAGRHVMTEKPMATRWEDGKRMVHACDHAGVHLFVVKQNRRNATLQLVKRAVEKTRFGRIYMVNINVFWTRPQSYYDSAPWRGTWEFDGGAFMNQASHYVDLLDWLIGPVESVQAYTATLARNIQVEDTGVVSIRWRTGALGSMNVTMLTYPEEPRRLDHHHRREGHRAGRRRRREQDRALGDSPTPIRTTRRWSRRATRPPRSTASAIRSTTTT